MLSWAIAFFIIAFVVSLVMGLMRGRGPRV